MPARGLFETTREITRVGQAVTESARQVIRQAWQQIVQVAGLIGQLAQCFAEESHRPGGSETETKKFDCTAISQTAVPSRHAQDADARRAHDLSHPVVEIHGARPPVQDDFHAAVCRHQTHRVLCGLFSIGESPHGFDEATCAAVCNWHLTKHRT